MLTAPSDRISEAVPAAVSIRVDGLIYPAETIANGAAYEICSSVPADGFMPNPRADGPNSQFPPFRRFVHSTAVDIVGGAPVSPDDLPLCVPLSATMSWSDVHRLAQASNVDAAAVPKLRTIRDTVRIRRGTRMIKILSGRQLAGVLRGWLPQGFCHREADIAHLRTPADLAVLATDNHGAHDRGAVFALRWRAVDASDFAVPYGYGIDGPDAYAGLTTLSPHQRMGAPVLGTGFAPSNQHIIPEFVTADLADLPLVAHAELIAFTDDGTEVLLYRYLAEQRAWGRLAGKQWRSLLDGIDGFAADQEYFPTPEAPARLVGLHDGSPYEAVADPRTNEFLVLAKVRALRHTVTSPARLSPRATWRGVVCTVVRETDEWLRLRLARPTSEGMEATGAACMERGIYEVWAPVNEARDRHVQISEYPQ